MVIETCLSWRLMLEQGAWAGRTRRARSGWQHCVHQHLFPSSLQKARESSPSISSLPAIFMEPLADLPLLMVSTSE